VGWGRVGCSVSEQAYSPLLPLDDKQVHCRWGGAGCSDSEQAYSLLLPLDGKLVSSGYPQHSVQFLKQFADTQMEINHGGKTDCQYPYGNKPWRKNRLPVLIWK